MKKAKPELLGKRGEGGGEREQVFVNEPEGCGEWRKSHLHKKCLLIWGEGKEGILVWKGKGGHWKNIFRRSGTLGP